MNSCIFYFCLFFSILYFLSIFSFIFSIFSFCVFFCFSIDIFHLALNMKKDELSKQMINFISVGNSSFREINGCQETAGMSQTLSFLLLFYLHWYLVVNLHVVFFFFLFHLCSVLFKFL